MSSLPIKEKTPPPPALGPEDAAPKTWFEVKVVDIYGKPVDGAEVVFTQGSQKEKAKTNGNGVARWKDVDGSSFATVKLAKPADLRDALKERWGKGEPAEGLEGEKLSIYDDDLSASLTSETPATLVLFKPLTRVRLVGMHFDTNKSFLRDTAMAGIKQVVEAYAAIPAGKLLVLGHTDSVADDAYNLDLSVERAEAVAAYLKDDVDAWLAWFDQSKPAQKRWGDHEVHRMIAALPSEKTVEGFQSWSNTERGTSLKVDGIAGPQTRKALVEAYMAIDGTTLPEGVTPVVHGCGEFFPQKDLGDNVASQENRRVEILCFPGEITPSAPGKKASDGEPQYKQWQDQVTNEIDFEADPTVSHVIRLTDFAKQPLPRGRCRVAAKPTVIFNADDDGYVTIVTSAGTKEIAVEWEPEDLDPELESMAGRFPFRQEVRVDAVESDDAHCDERLRNLGFVGDALTDRVSDYQRFFGSDATGLLDDIRDELVGWHDGGKRPEPKPPEPAGPSGGGGSFADDA